MKFFATLLIIPILFFPNVSFGASFTFSQLVNNVESLTEAVPFVQSIQCSDLSNVVVDNVTLKVRTTSGGFGEATFVITDGVTSSSVIDFVIPDTLGVMSDVLVIDLDYLVDCVGTFDISIDRTSGSDLTVGGSSTDVYSGGSCSGGYCGSVLDMYFVINGEFTAPFVKVGTGIYFFGEKIDTQADLTASNLTANVTDSVGSVFPITLLAISIFLAFYVVQKIIMFFGFAYSKAEKKK